MKHKLLITGFDPFGGETINPSYEVVKLLDTAIPDTEVMKLEIPTCFAVGGERLLAAIDEFRPDMVLCCGQAGGRSRISLEKLALNYMHASIADNAGAMPKDTVIVPGGADALVTKVDVLGIAEELNREKELFAVSYHAGTFVCNDLYYRLLYRMTEKEKIHPALGLFVHVPFLPEQIKSQTTPCMALDVIAEGLSMIVRKLVTTM